MASGPIVDRFDRWACGYDDSALQASVYRPVHANVLRQCAQRMSSPQRVLDIGCGTGRLLRDARRCFPDALLVGVDPSAMMLSVAAVSCAQMTAVRARAETLPFTDRAFDLVTATLTYRHWTDQTAGVAEVSRVLSDRGLIGLATVIAPPTGGRFRRRRLRSRVTLPESLLLALERADLDVLLVDHMISIGPIVDVAVVIAGRRPAGE